jgi:protein AATF/BFR2
LFCTMLLQEPIRTRFCNHDKQIEQAYDDLLNSSKHTLRSMMELQEVQLVAHIVFLSLV